MDKESESAIKVLSLLAKCTERLISLAEHLRARKEVRSVRREWNIRAYRTGPMLETYVEAELNDGRSIAWWLELTWDRRFWRIGYSVRISHDQGEDVLQGFPDLVTENLEGLVEKLELAVSNLVGSGETLSFHQGPWGKGG